jgi:hypothetical protein
MVGVNSDGDSYGRLRVGTMDLRQGKVRDSSRFSCSCSETLRRQVHGYRTCDSFSDMSSLHTTDTRVSTSSMRSNGSVLVPSRNRDDVGFRAVMALLGCDYELLTYTIGKAAFPYQDGSRKLTKS